MPNNRWRLPIEDTVMQDSVDRQPAASGSLSGSAMPGDRHVVRTVVAASIGAVFEWYDLLIYAMFVPTLSKLFFPTADPAVGVLLSLSTFASAWLVRPLGAVVIGSYADKVGRKPAMVLSAVLMMIGTGITGLLPGYASIGVAAPALLVLARLVQGFSAGSSAAPRRCWPSRTRLAPASMPRSNGRARGSRSSSPRWWPMRSTPRCRPPRCWNGAGAFPSCWAY
jgi:MFS family permease